MAIGTTSSSSPSTHCEILSQNRDVLEVIFKSLPYDKLGAFELCSRKSQEIARSFFADRRVLPSSKFEWSECADLPDKHKWNEVLGRKTIQILQSPYIYDAGVHDKFPLWRLAIDFLKREDWQLAFDIGTKFNQIINSKLSGNQYITGCIYKKKGLPVTSYIHLENAVKSGYMLGVNYLWSSPGFHLTLKYGIYARALRQKVILDLPVDYYPQSFVTWFKDNKEFLPELVYFIYQLFSSHLVEYKSPLTSPYTLISECRKMLTDELPNLDLFSQACCRLCLLFPDIINYYGMQAKIEDLLNYQQTLVETAESRRFFGIVLCFLAKIQMEFLEIDAGFVNLNKAKSFFGDQLPGLYWEVLTRYHYCKRNWLVAKCLMEELLPNPSYNISEVNYARCLYHLGEYELAAKKFQEQVMFRTYLQPSVYGYTLNSLLKSGQYLQAYEFLNEGGFEGFVKYMLEVLRLRKKGLLQRDSGTIEYHMVEDLVACIFELGKEQRKDSDFFDKILQNDQIADASFFCRLGYAEGLVGNHERAHAFLTRAYVLDPSNENLGLVIDAKFAVGDYAGVETLIHASPKGFKNFKIQLAYCKYRLGKNSEADHLFHQIEIVDIIDSSTEFYEAFLDFRLKKHNYNVLLKQIENVKDEKLLLKAYVIGASYFFRMKNYKLAIEFHERAGKLGTPDALSVTQYNLAKERAQAEGCVIS